MHQYEQTCRPKPAAAAAAITLLPYRWQMLKGVELFWKWPNSSPQWRTRVAGELLPILIKGYRKTNLSTKQFRIWKFILDLESHKVTEVIRCRLVHDRHVLYVHTHVYRSGIRFNQRPISVPNCTHTLQFSHQDTDVFSARCGTCSHW